MAPQLEEPGVIELAGLEAVLRCDDVELRFELSLAQFLVFAAITQQRPILDDLFDVKGDAIAAEHLLSGTQARAHQRGIGDGVTTRDGASREGDDDLAPFDRFDKTEPKFGLGHAAPALAGSKFQGCDIR